MTLYHAFESLLVPLIVVACAVHVTGRYMPQTRERVKAGLAASLGGTSAQGWRGWVARRLAPRVAAAGCATGCDTNSGCGTCESNTSASTGKSGAGAVNEQVIRFVRKS